MTTTPTPGTTTTAPRTAAPTIGDGDSGDDGSSGGGAIDGPLAYISPLGFYDTDGNAIELDGVDGATIGVEPAVADGVAYVMSFAAKEGQSFSNNAYVSSIDLDSGDTAVVAEIGFDRETDDATEVFEFPELTVVGGDVYVIREIFANRESTTLLRVNISSGKVVSETSWPGATGLTTDGTRIWAWGNAGLDVFDPSSETVTTLYENGTQFAEAAGTGVDLEPLVTTRSGDPLPADDFEAYTSTRSLNAGSVGALSGSIGNPPRFLLYGEGHLWVNYTAFGYNTAGGESVLTQAILRMDPDTAEITGVVGLGGAENYLEENSVTTLIGDKTFAGGALYVIDVQANGAILRIDAETLAADQVAEPCTSEFDCGEDDTFNRTEEGALWVTMTRSQDLGGGSSGGTIFLIELDPDTGAIIGEVSYADISPF